MNEYIAKAVRSADQGKGPENTNSSDIERPPIDVADFENRIGDDSGDLLHELISLFLESAADSLHGLREAIQETDYQLIGCIAHALFGSGASISAQVFAGHCRTLMEMAEAQNLDGIETVLDVLELEHGRINDHWQIAAP